MVPYAEKDSGSSVQELALLCKARCYRRAGGYYTGTSRLAGCSFARRVVW